MKPSNTPWVRDVVLLGGGHSHVLLIRQWAMRPLPGIRLTLVSNDVQSPYSGMLPGLIAGHYSVDDIHIDLLRLCAWAGIRLVAHTATGVDLDSRQLHFSDRPSIEFDVLSLDTGSTPDLSIPGAAEFVTPVKPVSDFFHRWTQIRNRIGASDESSLSIGVVGSGAGGFELIAAMRHALPAEKVDCYWFLRGDLPVRDRPARVGKLALDAAKRHGIHVITGFDVVKVRENELCARDGRVVSLQEILWCTAATAPLWPEQAGFSVDSRGFVLTNQYLQSESHDFVFATGDIGTQRQTPADKAGVYAVRQAPILFHNIRAVLQNRPLKAYRPQQHFLSLMATGPRRAIASRGSLAVEADWIWNWKDRIDQRFMRQFKRLSSMASEPVSQGHSRQAPATDMRCRGCGAKVGEHVLQTVIESFSDNHRLLQNRLDKALQSPASDAAVLNCRAGALVQSVDMIDQLLDDPYLLGRLAALHALSDVVTLDVMPHSAQAIITLPQASDALLERDLRLVMSGLVETLNEEGCPLAGGHTTQGQDLSIGVVVNALAMDHRESIARSPHTPTKGDKLILTQAIGIGVLFAGLMQQKSSGRDIAETLDIMQQSNSPAARTLREHHCYAMTDITGFGLLSHLMQLMSGLDLSATIHCSSIPLLPGALKLTNQGVRSSLWPQNAQITRHLDISTEIDPDVLALLSDPQTCGGLLAIVPTGLADQCVHALLSLGYQQSAVIGTVEPNGQVRIVA